jgi:hypothetical protein
VVCRLSSEEEGFGEVAPPGVSGFWGELGEVGEEGGDEGFAVDVTYYCDY